MIRQFGLWVARLALIALFCAVTMWSFAVCALTAQWLVSPPPGPSGTVVALAFALWIPVLAAGITAGVRAMEAIRSRPGASAVLKTLAPILD